MGTDGLETRSVQNNNLTSALKYQPVLLTLYMQPNIMARNEILPVKLK